MHLDDCVVIPSWPMRCCWRTTLFFGVSGLEEIYCFGREAADADILAFRYANSF